MARIHSNILDLIGHTPLVSVSKINPNKDVEILAKLEYFNPAGSVKERPALYMIEEAEKDGSLTRDKIILEATSGNTGIGLALVAAVKGYQILLVMSEAVSEERVKILRAMGVDIKFTPARFSTDGAIEYVYKLIREEPEKYWLADQFNNNNNWKAHYYSTAIEIWEQTDHKLDIVVATMGTSGTLMGIARRFRELDKTVKVVGVEPYLGHKIQGLKNMKESYQPGIFDRKQLSRTIYIDDDEAFQTSRLLTRQEGLFVGMSSGAAMAAALRLASELDHGRIVVLLPDGGERYLSTSLFEIKKKSGLRLYNTLSRKKEDFIPLHENRVSIYACGPTLSHSTTLNQCRRFIFADLIKRYLEFKGLKTTLIMNVTDLDDRTIEGAEAADMSLKDFTDQYYEDFLRDLDILLIKQANEYPRASEYVDEMIAITRKLLERGFAYEKFRSIYFDISRFKPYGKLSRIDLDKIHLGKTVDLDQYEKDNPRDFTLLKRSTLKELKKGIFYKTEWGNIRPSWHLECSAMGMKFLGSTYDIHASGVDLIFPHNENTTAICQAVTNKPLSNYWVHNEPVMEKDPSTHESDAAYLSLKNILNQGYTGREVRYWLLSRHYRKPIFFSLPKLDGVKRTLANLDIFVKKLHSMENKNPYHGLEQIIYDLRHQFKEAMDDDLNIAAALAALFRFIHRINKILDNQGLSSQGKKKILKELKDINLVLGVMELEAPKEDQEINALILKREQARKKKEWYNADQYRLKLLAMGIEVFDTKDGPQWRKL